MVRNKTGPGMSKIDHVQAKAHPSATTDKIIDYIKPTIHQKADTLFLILERMKTMSRVQKVVVAVKEIDTDGKIKSDFFGIVDIIKNILLVLTTGLKILQRKRVRLIHNGSKGTYYLVNNFRKHIFNVECRIYDNVSRKKALEVLHFSYV